MLCAHRLRNLHGDAKASLPPTSHSSHTATLKLVLGPAPPSKSAVGHTANIHIVAASAAIYVCLRGGGAYISLCDQPRLLISIFAPAALQI